MRVVLASVLPILSIETEGYQTTLTADLTAGAATRTAVRLSAAA